MLTLFNSDVGLGEYASDYDLTDDNNNAWIVRTPSPPPTVVPATPPASTPGFHASYTRPEFNAPPTSTNSTPRDSTSVTSRLSSFFTGKRTSSPPASDSSPLGQDDGGWRRGPLAGVSGAVEGDASALWAALEGLVKELESLPRTAPPPPSSRRLSTNWHSPLFRGGSHKSANVFRGGGSQRNRLEANRNTTEGIQRTKDGFISLDILGVQLLRSFLEKDRSLTTHSSERARSRASPPPQRRRRQVLTGLGVVDDEGGDSGGDAAGSGRWGNQGERGVRDDGVGNPAALSGYEMALCSRVRYLSRGVSALRIFWGSAVPSAALDRPVDLSIFPALQDLHLYGVPLEHLQGLFTMRMQLKSLRFERAPLVSLQALLSSATAAKNTAPPSKMRAVSRVPHIISLAEVRRRTSEKDGTASAVDANPDADELGKMHKSSSAAIITPCSATGSAADEGISGTGVGELARLELRLGSGTPALRWSCLEVLSVYGCGLRELDVSLRLLPRVKRLTLAHNRVSRIEFLQDCAALEELDLSYNLVETLQGIHIVVGNLRSLNLRGNRISSTAGLERVFSLEEVDLSHNAIRGLEHAARLSALPLLRRVRLEGNPLEKEEGKRYRISVLSLLYRGRGAELESARARGDRGREFGLPAGVALERGFGGEISLDGLCPSKKELADISRLQFDSVEQVYLPPPSSAHIATAAYAREGQHQLADPEHKSGASFAPAVGTTTVTASWSPADGMALSSSSLPRRRRRRRKKIQKLGLLLSPSSSNIGTDDGDNQTRNQRGRQGDTNQVTMGQSYSRDHRHGTTAASAAFAGGRAEHVPPASIIGTATANANQLGVPTGGRNFSINRHARSGADGRGTSRAGRRRGSRLVTIAEPDGGRGGEAVSGALSTGYARSSGDDATMMSFCTVPLPAVAESDDGGIDEVGEGGGPAIVDDLPKMTKPISEDHISREGTSKDPVSRDDISPRRYPDPELVPEAVPEDEGGGGGVLEDKARVPAPVVCARIEAMSRDVNEPVRWQSAVDSDGGGGGGGEEEEEELLRVVRNRPQSVGATVSTPISPASASPSRFQASAPAGNAPRLGGPDPRGLDLLVAQEQQQLGQQKHHPSVAAPSGPIPAAAQRALRQINEIRSTGANDGSALQRLAKPDEARVADQARASGHGASSGLSQPFAPSSARSTSGEPLRTSGGMLDRFHQAGNVAPPREGSDHDTCVPPNTAQDRSSETGIVVKFVQSPFKAETETEEGFGTSSTSIEPRGGADTESAASPTGSIKVEGTQDIPTRSSPPERRLTPDREISSVARDKINDDADSTATGSRCSSKYGRKDTSETSDVKDADKRNVLNEDAPAERALEPCPIPPPSTVPRTAAVAKEGHVEEKSGADGLGERGLGVDGSGRAGRGVEDSVAETRKETEEEGCGEGYRGDTAYKALLIAEHLELYCRQQVFNGVPYLSYGTRHRPCVVHPSIARSQCHRPVAVFRETALPCVSSAGQLSSVATENQLQFSRGLATSTTTGGGAVAVDSRAGAGGVFDLKRHVMPESVERQMASALADAGMAQTVYRRGITGEARGDVSMGEVTCVVVAAENTVFVLDGVYTRKDTLFSEAPKPRVLLAAPLACLEGTTIGFRLQKLELHFDMRHLTPAGVRSMSADRLEGDALAEMPQPASLVLLTRDRSRTFNILNTLEPLASKARRKVGLPPTVVENRDGETLEAIARALPCHTRVSTLTSRFSPCASKSNSAPKISSKPVTTFAAAPGRGTDAAAAAVSHNAPESKSERCILKTVVSQLAATAASADGDGSEPSVATMTGRSSSSRDNGGCSDGGGDGEVVQVYTDVVLKGDSGESTGRNSEAHVREGADETYEAAAVSSISSVESEYDRRTHARGVGDGVSHGGDGDDAGTAAVLVTKEAHADDESAAVAGAGEGDGAAASRVSGSTTCSADSDATDSTAVAALTAASTSSSSPQSSFLKVLMSAFDASGDGDQGDGDIDGCGDGAVVVFQLLMQRWELRPWVAAPRTLVATKEQVALMDEDHSKMQHQHQHQQPSTASSSAPATSLSQPSFVETPRSLTRGVFNSRGCPSTSPSPSTIGNRKPADVSSDGPSSLTGSAGGCGDGDGDGDGDVRDVGGEPGVVSGVMSCIDVGDLADVVYVRQEEEAPEQVTLEIRGDGRRRQWRLQCRTRGSAEQVASDIRRLSAERLAQRGSWWWRR